MKPKYTLAELKSKIQAIRKGEATPRQVEGWLLAAFTNYKNFPKNDIWRDGRGVGLEIVRNLKRWYKLQASLKAPK